MVLEAYLTIYRCHKIYCSMKLQVRAFTQLTAYNFFPLMDQKVIVYIPVQQVRLVQVAYLI